MISPRLQSLGYNTFLERPMVSSGRMTPLAVSNLFPEGSLDGPINTYARFTTDIAFNSIDSDTAGWGSGTINLSNGEITEEIVAGDTGDIAATTFIYYDVAHKGVLLTTTVPKDAVGTGKTLLAIVERVADSNKKAKVTPVFATGLVVSDITADQIQAGTITANEINTGSINIGDFSGDLDDIDDGSTYYRTTLDEVDGAGRAFDGLGMDGTIAKGFLDSHLSGLSLPTNGIRIDSNGIYGRKAGVTTFFINTAGDAYFSGTIEASTITGGTVRTSSGTTRVEMNGASNFLSVFTSSTERIRLAGSLLTFFTSGGLESGRLVGSFPGSVRALEVLGYDIVELGLFGGSFNGRIAINGNQIIFTCSSGFNFTAGGLIQGSLELSGGTLFAHTGVVIGVGTGAPGITIVAGGTRTAQIYQRNGAPNDALRYETNGIHQFVTDGVSRMGIDNAGVDINGNLSKTSGSFDIPHPDPSKKKGTRLRHSFVESPTAGDNIYRYTVEVVDREACIELPDYFDHLNENPMAWVTSVDIKAYARAVVKNGRVYISANKDGVYNVLVIGTRKDPGAVKGWESKGLEYWIEKHIHET